MLHPDSSLVAVLTLHLRGTGWQSSCVLTQCVWCLYSKADIFDIVVCILNTDAVFKYLSRVCGGKGSIRM